MEKKFKVGDIVYARMYPAKKLVVSRYVDKLYYCKMPENLKLKELVFFERELMAAHNQLASK